MSKQKTISSPIKFNGFGLHTGKSVNMTIEPAEVNHGIQFLREDLDNAPIIPATVDYVSETQRSTTIEKNGNKVVTVEHLLSACYALGVDNLLVKLNSEELPILDGSAKEYVASILSLIHI